MNDVHDSSVKELPDSQNLAHQEGVRYSTGSNDFNEEEAAAFDYDMAIFFSPSGITAFKKNFGDKYNHISVATFGPATAKAAHDAGLTVVIEAPTKEHPSMTGALRQYLRKQEK